jgi:hypothetical protein
MSIYVEGGFYVIQDFQSIIYFEWINIVDLWHFYLE